MESRTFQLQGELHQVRSLVNRWARAVISDNKYLFGKWQAGGFVLQERIPPLMTTSMKPSIWTHPLDYIPTQTTFIRVSWTATGDGATEITATCEDDLAQGWFVELCDVLEAQPNADAQHTTRAERAEDTRQRSGTVGRRRDPDNDWASQQVNQLGRVPADVQSEWIQRRRNHGTLEQLADPTDSFKHAIKPKKK